LAASAANTPWHQWWKVPAIISQVVLLLIVITGIAARVIALPSYTPDSGDEWGNTMAPLRLLFERGDPGVFFHPSLYYYVTGGLDAALFGVVKQLGVVPGSASMTDLFVRDERYFVFAARAVSVLSAALAMWALYAFATSLWNRQAGLLAAALLAVLPLHAVYSDAVRVDTLFLPVFIYAFARIARIVDSDDRASYDLAGLFTGFAIGTNYNGVVLVPWLVGAHLLRGRDHRTIHRIEPPPHEREAARNLWRALALTGLAFVVSSPFVFINAQTFIRNFAFISGLSVSEHPGMEGVSTLYYALDLMRMSPYLCPAIALAIAVIVCFGNRTERFVLSLPIGYFIMVSLVRTKFDRFILPAAALFLLVMSGMPFVLARRFASRRLLVVAAYASSYLLFALCIATLMSGSIPIPHHPMLARPDAPLFDWIEENVPPQSGVLVESGILPLVDTFMEPGRFGTALRDSMVARRPNLDQRYVGAVFVGGSNYDPQDPAAKGIDYAIVSPRNVTYIEGRCDAFPGVCAFYRELKARGQVVFETPAGFERILVYDVRHRDS
jgi:hypothetical protein